MFQRHLLPVLADELQRTPAVALPGPRQSGKTPLTLETSKFAHLRRSFKGMATQRPEYLVLPS